MALSGSIPIVQWKGMKALEVMNLTLPDRLAGQKLRRAYRFALKPTKTEAQKNVSKINRTSALFHSIDTNIYGRDINTMYGVVGPRRKKNTWNMKGRHAYPVELGTKAHKITAKAGKVIPIITKQGFTGRFAKSIDHPGSQGKFPFKKAMDSTYGIVGKTAADKVAEIMDKEIRDIWNQYGQVITKNDL